MRDRKFEGPRRTECQGGGEFEEAIDRYGGSVGICPGPCPYRGDGVVPVGTPGKIKRVFLIRFWAALALARLRSLVCSTPVRDFTHGRGRECTQGGTGTPPPGRTGDLWPLLLSGMAAVHPDSYPSRGQKRWTASRPGACFFGLTSSTRTTGRGPRIARLASRTAAFSRRWWSRARSSRRPRCEMRRRWPRPRELTSRPRRRPLETGRTRWPCRILRWSSSHFC